ncbi:DUF2968 domain-containing protein [Paraburkholderia phosphatilytica]|uniref:DUF2968 domain-containing protein n=1 Tax=Paraburkholderia phosphatilytica TaxID=2282883 RepID=UPI000E4C5114|nr:DUF2968 domain-containing protein [Paraburkholderia phosphatilytica]
MDRKSTFRQVALALLIGIGGSGCTFAQPTPAAAPVQPASDAVVATPAATTALPVVSGQTPGADAAQVASQAASQPVLNADEAKQSTGGNVAELQQLIHGSALTEFRTTYNGSYGASLLFDAKEMNYWVALFQQKTFWRVIKTTDATRAELIYKDFARQTLQLSSVEIRRTQLEAQKAFTDRMIALSQEHASRLQADLAVAQQQQQIVASQQKQNHDQADALQAQKIAAQAQLRDAQRQVRELQHQLEGGLPGTTR